MIIVLLYGPQIVLYDSYAYNDTVESGIKQLNVIEFKCIAQVNRVQENDGYFLQTDDMKWYAQMLL